MRLRGRLRISVGCLNQAGFVWLPDAFCPDGCRRQAGLLENAIVIVAAVCFLPGRRFAASLRFHLRLGDGSLFRLGVGGLSVGSFARFRAVFDSVRPIAAWLRVRGCVRVRQTGRRLLETSRATTGRFCRRVRHKCALNRRFPG